MTLTLWKNNLNLLLLLGLSATALASELHFNYLKEGHILAELGGYGGILGKNQHINIQSRIGNDFTVNSRTGGNVLLGLGYEHWLKKNDRFDLSYGLGLFYLAPTKVNGNILLENQFNNFDYSYQASHFPLYGILKASRELSNPHLQLFVDVGIGPNFMFLSDYRETPLLSNSVPDNEFSSTTTTNLSVTAGFGFEMKNVFGTHPLRCGYRFYYLGYGAFNHDNKVDNSLSTGASFANSGVCSAVF